MRTPDDSYHSMIWHGPPFPRDHDVIVFAVESITKSFSHLNISRERREDYCYITRLVLSLSKPQMYELIRSSYVIHTLLETCTMEAMLCVVIFQVCKYSQVACWQVPTMSAGVECSFSQMNTFQIFTHILLWQTFNALGMSSIGIVRQCQRISTATEMDHHLLFSKIKVFKVMWNRSSIILKKESFKSHDLFFTGKWWRLDDLQIHRRHV